MLHACNISYSLSKFKLLFKDLTNGRVGTWVQEEVAKLEEEVAFMNEGSAVSTSDNFGLEWAGGYGPDNYWTGTQKIFLNSEVQLAHNDGNALASFVCEHKAQDGGSEFVIKPLVRSLLQWK